MNQQKVTRKRVRGKPTSKPAEAIPQFLPAAKGSATASKVEKLQQQIELLQRQKDELLNQERSSAIEEINKMIQTFDIKATDLMFAQVPGSGLPVKYRSGTNVWSGRGRKPKWVEDHLTNGGSLDEILVS